MKFTMNISMNMNITLKYLKILSEKRSEKRLLHPHFHFLKVY